jgi:ribosomal protein S18 acetylase RimI-like enzyme
MNDPVLQNMIDLYHGAASFCQLKEGNNNCLYWVNNKQNHWPRTVIGDLQIEGVSDLVGNIENHKMPPFLIFDSSKNMKSIPQLEQNGFREVQRWQGMVLNKTDFLKSSTDGLNVKVVDSNNAMQHWGWIVKDVMLPNQTLPVCLLNGWLENDNYLAYLGYENEEPVSAGIAFLNDDVAGLYFIATLPENRGNGFASSLVSKLIADCFDKGARKIVLHASVAGEKMYHNMGFKVTGPISTYWKVGTF